MKKRRKEGIKEVMQVYIHTGLEKMSGKIDAFQSDVSILAVTMQSVSSIMKVY
jgi:hypothetical protein